MKDGSKSVSLLQNIKSIFAWWFSVNDIDDHFVIKFFGIKFCKKHGVNINFQEVTSLGVTTEKRTPQVICSLTTYPARINTVYKTISTLLTQTVKPDKVVLWLASSQFPDKNLPQNLTRLLKFGLEIKWVEKDIRSFKKLVPALKEYPEDIIITVDDDNYYDKRLLEKLYNSYLENPSCIHARQAFVVKTDLKGKLKMTARNYVYNSTYLPSFLNEPVGCGGVLYPPHSLQKNVLNDIQFMQEVPTNDDLWFWAHALRNGTKINVIKDNYKLKNYIIEGSQADALWQKNMINSTAAEVGMSGTDTINKMCELFPQITCRAKQKYTKDDFEAFILTYNRKEFLQEALKSLLNQTIGDLKITVMDNGSTDGTDVVMQELAQKYPNVFYHRRDKNGKQIENFIDAVMLVEKEYAIFFHDDDILHPDYFKYALMAVNKYPKVSIISSSYKEFGNPTNENWKNAGGRCSYLSSKDDFASYLYYVQRYAYSSTIYRTLNLKKHISNIEAYSKFGKIGDKPFVIDSMYSDDCAVILRSKKFLRYRVHPGQDTQSSGPYYDEIIEYNKYYKQFMYKTLKHRILYNLINYKQLKNAYIWGGDNSLSLNEFVKKAINEGAGCFWTKLCVSPCGKLFINIAYLVRKFVRNI